jgi:hypothetical protein
MLDAPSPYRKKIVLPGVGIEMEPPPGVELRVDGEVPSLYQHTEDVYERSNPHWPETRSRLDEKFDQLIDWCRARFGMFSDADEATAHGFMHKVDENRIHYAIAKKAGLEKNMSLFADGHESGEFLQTFNRQEVLQEALKSEGVDLDVSHYSGEDFADLAGFLALLKAKKAGDDTIRVPFFRSNAENREKMGRLFGLEPAIGPRPGPRGF